MSVYTPEKARARAEAAAEIGDLPRIIREHVEASVVLSGDAARIAAGYAAIARRRLEEQQWRADAYARLARGEDITS